MRRTARPPRWPVVLVGLMVLTVNLSAMLMFGPENAARIAFTGCTTALMDGLIERRDIGGLPVIDLRIDQDSLRALGADLPFSGGRNIDASLAWGEVDVPVRFRYRGVMLTTHYLGNKRSFRLKLPKRNPFEPIRSLNVINPKTQDFLANRLANEIGRRMGVAVPKDDYAWVRINGHDLGLMETIEQIDGRFERSRGKSGKQVPVFEGDLSPLQGDSMPVGRELWASADAWRYASKADGAEALQRLKALVAWVNADDSTADIDTLARLLDVHAYLGYCAAIQLMGSYHIDGHHNQWLVENAGSGLFYPVLWDVFPLFDPTGGHFHMANDALAFRILGNGDARLERDRQLHRIWKELYVEGGLDDLLGPMVARITPAVLSDREKWTSAAIGNEHVYRSSDLQWFRAVDNLRRRLRAHWASLGEGFRITRLQVERQDSTLHVRYDGEVSLRIGSAQGGVALLSGSGTGSCVLQEDGAAMLIHPEAEVPKEHSARFAQWTWITTRPVDVVIRFNGPVPRNLVWTNAATDEPLTPE